MKKKVNEEPQLVGMVYVPDENLSFGCQESRFNKLCKLFRAGAEYLAAVKCRLS